jgi:hypothetical protein
MGKHGFWIGRKRRVVREEVVLEVFRGADKGSTQLTSPLGNEEVLLTVEKVTIKSLKMGVGRVSVSEGVLKLIVEEFTFFVVPPVHRIGSSF